MYYKPTCPFCQEVLRFIERHQIKEIVLKDKSANQEYEYELASVGGKIQVPCLFIDGNPLYESNDIIEWLKAHF